MDLVQIGLGPIGKLCIESLAGFPDLRLVGALDIAPGLAGQRLPAVIAGAPDVPVVASVDALPRAAVAVHSTRSTIAAVQEQLLELVREGYHVVSSCEELSAPWYYDPERARVLDAAAKGAGVSVVGAGVNPGYCMDLVPVLLSQATRSVRSVTVKRVVDVARRRGALQNKVGVGISVTEFEQRRAELGHRGLAGSVDLLRSGLGWPAAPVQETLEPVAALGHVKGIHNVARYEHEGRRIVLDLTMSIAASPELDTIDVEGDPPLHLRVDGGIMGDVATATLTLHRCRAVARARPGLLTVLDLPVRPLA